MSWPKITADTPIENLEVIHGVIWQHVVDSGEKPITGYLNDCVACEYTRCLTGRVCCDLCPIDWGDLGGCTDPLNIFYLWISSVNKQTQAEYNIAKRLAAVIRDVKFKK